MNLPTISKKILTPNEVLQIFSITRPTLADWCKKGLLEKIQIPGQRRVYVSAASIDKLINSKEA